MAAPITRKDLNKLEVIPYNPEARPLIKTGDLFFCSGDYFFSKLIRKFGKSPWSHIGIVYKEEKVDRVLFLESELVYGVRMAPLSKYIRDNNGRKKPYKGVVVIASIDSDISNNLDKAICFGMDELTRPYDNFEILRILLRILFKKGRKSRDRRYICSEYVQACFEKAGVNFSDTNGFISPESIWADERVQLKFRIL